jgi:ABC-type transport system substrate-binding protein
MNTKAIARTTAALAAMVIVLGAGLIGTIYYYGTRPTGPAALTTTTTAALPVPDFVKSNTYIFESGNSFQWLDPAVSYYAWDGEIDNNVYETLLWYNANSTTDIIPWLAESYQKISNIQYQFKLRQGITFQDGTPFNAKAVWFSFNRVLVMDGTSGTGTHGVEAAWIIEQLLDTSLFSGTGGSPTYDAAWVQKVLNQNFIQIVDPYTINMNLKNPTTQFELLIAYQTVADQVSPSFVVSRDFPSACKTSACGPDDIDYTAYFNHIAGHGEVAMNYLNLPDKGAKAGTGPYYIDSVNPTTYEVVLKANPNYWGGSKNWKGPPITVSIKTIDYVYVPQLSTRILDVKAGKASGIQVSAADLYSVADRDQWLKNGNLVSVIPGVTLHGPFPSIWTTWFNFDTNVTDTAGHVRKFQPFADIRFRLALSSAVNLTDANININNRLGQVANTVISPGNYPEGSYDPAIKPIYSYDLKNVERLLVDAQQHPLTNFVDMNGHPYPAGTIDNSFAPDKPQTIELYVPAGDALDQRILSTIVENVNRISIRDKLGLTLTVVPVPGGQQYTLAGKHQIYFYWGGWIADYNHVIDWLAPMFPVTGWYPQNAQMNYTALNNLYSQAVDADHRGDLQALLRINKEMQTLANEQVMYLLLFYPLQFMARTSFLQGFYYNPATTLYFYAAFSYKTS